MTAKHWSGFSICRLLIEALSSSREYYFGGVLSKVERSQAGPIEAIVTYSNLSEVEGRFYSRQAREFVERPSRARNATRQFSGSRPRPQARSWRLRTPPAVAPPPAAPPAADQPAATPQPEVKPSSRAEPRSRRKKAEMPTNCREIVRV